MKFAQNIYEKKIVFWGSRRKAKKMLVQIAELKKRFESKSGRLADDNRKKKKIADKNAMDIYNIRNKIINDLKKEMRGYVKDSEGIKRAKKLILHRPEEELKDLIKNIENDTDLKKEVYPNSARTKLLEFLNNVINKKINSKEEVEKVYVNNFLAYKQELEGKNLRDKSRAKGIKNFINDAEYIVFGPLFFPEQESKKLDIAARGVDDLINFVSKMGESVKKEMD